MQLMEQNEQQPPQELMTTEQLQQELINDIIVNDLVIIDGTCLQQTSATEDEGIINCHFDKDGQINENYYIEHCHESDAMSEAAINESSNEVRAVRFGPSHRIDNTLDSHCLHS